MSRKPAELRSALLCRPLDLRPPRRRPHGRKGKREEQDESGVNRCQQYHRDGKPQDPSERGKQRHVHVVEHEDLVAEHRQPIEIVRQLLVRDRHDRSLESRDVRLECDRNLVAKATLPARAYRAQEPGRGSREAKPNRRALHHPRTMFEHALTKQHQPQSDQRVGKSGQLRQDERLDH